MGVFSRRLFCVPPSFDPGRKGHEMKAKQSKKQDKQYQIPMVVTDEVIRDFGIKQEDVTWRRIGNRKCRVVMVDATEEEYKAYMAPIWAEIKREDRDGRCMVKGKNGRLIRCPESNRCEECKHFSEASRERNKPASLSVLMDEGAEPAAEGSFEDDVIYETILEDLRHTSSRRPPSHYRVFDNNGVNIYTPNTSTKAAPDVPFTVKVSISDLNIRKGPGTDYAKTGKFTGKGVFTIVEVQSGQGASAGWGRLKSGAGWISLDYAVKTE